MSDRNTCCSGNYCRIVREPKTALYCRTAQHCDFAIETQMDKLSCFARENGYTSPYYYIDNGKNGLTLDRPAMNRLMADIRGGEVGRVIVVSLDRIARGLALTAEWVSLLKEAGVLCIALDIGGNDMSYEFEFWFGMTR